jgi:2-dehydro-3-deoxyphosphogluconate aldolase/(4S)-4-hydroxy-2-oxoglutarate aldolase
MNKQITLQDILVVPIVGIVRNISPEDFRELLPIYQEAGLKNIEVTMNTPGAVEMIRYANHHFGKHLVTGAGTVCTPQDLQEALGAGARFIVAPVTDENIIAACVRNNVPVMPGAFTPTEIYRAWTAGAAMVKVFPATAMGPQYIKDILAPLKQVPLMPTGGIDLANIRDFFAAGASAAGIGGKLFDAGMIARRDWKSLKAHFGAFSMVFA